MSNRFLERANTFINGLGRTLGTVGIIVLVVMMILTGTDVFLRYVFNKPILGSAEITEFMMLALGFTAIAWCTATKAHIKVDILSNYIPDTGKILSDTLFYILYLLLSAFIAWRSFLEAMAVRPTSIAAGARSSILDIPYYPFYMFISIVFGLIALMLLIYIGQSIAQVVKRWT